VSYGIGAASEWQDIAKELATGLVILVILERVYLTRPVAWLEEHVDYLSLQVRHALLASARLPASGADKRARATLAFRSRCCSHPRASRASPSCRSRICRMPSACSW
jgi:hypothetical protein